MAHYTELEKKQIQLDLDLKLLQENFQKAKDEAKGMSGENLSTVFIFLPTPDSDLIVILQKKCRRL